LLAVQHAVKRRVAPRFSPPEFDFSAGQRYFLIIDGTRVPLAVITGGPGASLLSVNAVQET
jgi:hypothetical protein